MKTIQSVIQKSLVRSAVLIILAIFLLTNLGLTFMFSRYVANIRANEIHMSTEAALQMLADGELTSEETTTLRQTANQSSLHVKLYTNDHEILFDSLVSGNGNKRNLLSKEKKVIDLSELLYAQKNLITEQDTPIIFEYGQQTGWLVHQEDIGFLLGVNAIYLIMLFIAIPTVLYFSKWLSRQLASPIVQIQLATEKIHSGAYHDVHIDRSQTVELDALASAIEDLAFQLDHQETLRRRLTTDVAHELRSPLAVIRSQLEGMSDGVLDLSPERFHRLDSEVVRLTKLIDDLGELNLLENDQYKLHLEQVDLSALTADIVKEHVSFFESKDLVLEAEIEASVHWTIDRERFKQILVNLLSNSFKYTDEGNVKVSLFKKLNEVILEVEDTGTGISENDLPFIFQRFYRADLSRSRDTGGAGIGLAITKQLVLAQGGRIEAESFINKGTKIRICFTTSS